MIRTRILIVAILALLSLGLAAGFAAGGANADGETSTDITTTAPVTDPGTTTAPVTDPGTTTTTPDPTTTTDTTTPTTTTTDTPPPPAPTTTDQVTTQAAPTTPTTTDSTPPPTPPTAPCDTTQITCGNNAATQVAIVSQICNAVSGPSLITIQVQSLDGKPLGNFTVSPSTTCLNVLSITQVVQQFCINCTLVVVPPPPAVAARASTPTFVPAPARAIYCMPQPVYRTDGTWGDTVDLVVGQQQTDPRYAGATPATYTAGHGYSCPNNTSPNDNLNPAAPLFTLTVPASFIGQWINLCVQPKLATQKVTCHSIRIDNGATVAIPVTSNVAATVTTAAGVKGARKTIVKKNKSRKQIHAASKAFAGLQTTPKRHHVKTKTSKHSTKAVKH